MKIIILLFSLYSIFFALLYAAKEAFWLFLNYSYVKKIKNSVEGVKLYRKIETE